MGDVFLIGARGLEKIGGEPILIYPGGVYGYGYSDSPDRVVVTDVSGEWVTFYRYPYTDEKRQREQLKMFRNIAQKGTQKMLAHHLRFESNTGMDMPEWMRKEVNHFRSVLAGVEGLQWDRNDMIQVGIRVRYRGTGDVWSEFERYYPHAVSGQLNTDTFPVLESFDFCKREAFALRDKIAAGNLPDFEWVETIPYH